MSTFKVFSDDLVDNYNFRGDIHTRFHTSENLVYLTVTGDEILFPSDNSHIEALGTLGAPWNLRGIDALGPLGVNGQDLVIINNTSQNMVVTNDDGAAAIGNRIYVPGGLPYAVIPRSLATFMYDRSHEHWFLVSSSSDALTGLTPGTYGNATNIPQIVVNSSGQLSSITNIPITSPGTLKAFAEFVQITQSPNNSVPPGTPFQLLTDNPSGVYNSPGSGITTSTQGTQGTVFQFANSGTYVIDYEASLSAAGSLVLWTGLVSGGFGAMAADNNTISGSSTATTWIHGRAIETIAAPTYMFLTSKVGTAAVPTAGNASGFFIVRITILQIA
jgi:hypothetical protein